MNPDPSSLGLSASASADGSYSWDASSVSVPPQARTAISAVQGSGANLTAMARDAMGSLANQGITAYTGSPQLGAWVQSFIDSAPVAGSGPGGCFSGNPSDFAWEAVFGPYNPPAPGTFEEYAYALIRADYDLNAKCPDNPNDPNAIWWSPEYAQSRMPIVLAAAVSSWNELHGNDWSTAQYDFMGMIVPNTGGTRTFYASTTPGNDPITIALNGVLYAANPVYRIDPYNYNQPAGPDNGIHDISLVVNNGPTPSFGFGGPSFGGGMGGLLGNLGGGPDPTGYYPPPVVGQDSMGLSPPPLAPSAGAMTLALTPVAAGIGAAIYFANPLLAVGGLIGSVLASAYVQRG